MTLLTIPLRCARAKWLRTLLLAAVFTLGVASMTGLRQVSAVIGDSFEKKLVSYGANILVMPEQKTLKISYGGYALGDVALEKRLLPLAASYAAIETMPLRANIAVIAICYWIRYSHSPLELHLATLCLAGMVVALTLEIVLAYKQHQLQAQKDPS